MQTKYTFKMLDDERWWGCCTLHAYCPLDKNSEFSMKLYEKAGNQSSPFFVSDKGRYICSDEPFDVTVKDGIFEIDGENVELVNAGNTLREAYTSAQNTHFPCDGKELERTFFSVPQYNSWIEFAYYPTQSGIIRYAHEIIDHGFAPGIFIIDEGWHVHTGYGDWEFDFGRFPNPKAMVDELHSLGFKVMLWVTPFVNPAGPKYFRSLHPLKGTDPESAKHIYKRNDKGDVAIITWWNGVAAILDMTNKYDREYLDKQLHHLINDYGIDGFKFDGGNANQYCDDHVINGVYAPGHTPYECNAAWNEFGTKYPFHEFKDTVKGGGKNAIQRLHDRDHSWTNNGINEIIPCAINAGLIGHPFICPDMIGGGEWLNRYTPGFKTDEELFVRMAQCSALFPMMQFSWAPWEALSEENTKLCLDAAKLHISMADEIKKLVADAEKTGEPIIRSLEYNDPCQGFGSITDEFMLGEDILVCPVVTQNTYKRNVVFPEGAWIDDDGNEYPGRTEMLLDAPLEKLLWFRRKK